MLRLIHVSDCACWVQGCPVTRLLQPRFPSVEGGAPPQRPGLLAQLQLHSAHELHDVSQSQPLVLVSEQREADDGVWMRKLGGGGRGVFGTEGHGKQPAW
eukprot:7383974-Prymnesium_polylepis.6